MMPVFLTRSGGIGQIPCPLCSRPLLLALPRRGRWMVGYSAGFRVRPGREALLVCPSADCEHVEPVQITARPDDSVVFNPWSAAGTFRLSMEDTDQTLAEVWLTTMRLRERLEQSADPRLPSLYRFWRRQHRTRYRAMHRTLRQAYVQGSEIVCHGKDWRLRGRVRSLIDRGLLLEPHAAGEAVYLSIGTLVTASLASPDQRLPIPLRLDFGGEGSKGQGPPAPNLANRFAIVAGYPVQLLSISASDICRVATDDPEVARALHLWSSRGQQFIGEVPAALVERVYRLVRYGHVGDYRLHVVAQTGYGKVRAETRDLEVARALKMNRYTRGRGRSLRWWKEYRLSEIKLESVEFPDHLRPAVRPRQFH